MSEKPEHIVLAATGDLHVNDADANRYRDLFAEISEKADVLALTGDLTNFGRTREAENLAEDLRHCTIPVVAVLGNHDYECGQPEEVVRILQGAAVGGEVPSAWVFVAEHAPDNHRGYALGFLQAGLTFGYLLGALTATLLAQVFTPAEILDYAWRFPFLLGGVFGVIGVWLRRWLSETPVFLQMQARRQAGAELPLRTVLREHRSALLPAMILTCVLTSAVVVLVVITPTMMQKTFGMSPSHTFALSALGIVFLNIGCVLAGLLVDRIGAWRAVLVYSLLLPVGIALLYASLIAGGVWLGAAYAVAGLSCGVVGAVPSVMVGLFPAQVRVSGISFTYNIAYALWASTTPLLLIALMPTSPWICVGYCVVMGAVGVASVALFGKRHTLAA